jgi:hypothetical protein
MTDAVRIAMWSGPRNLSTAMMRAFENRPDCAVVDEPFYAAYLAATGLEHPMREAVLASQPTDWRAVAAGLLGAVPGGRAVFYQKHMTHHMLPGFGRDWMLACRNAFLIRDPAAVLRSYVARRESVTLEDIGLPQQVTLFDAACDRLGVAPPVLDAADVRENPEGALRALCVALGISFLPQMLRWPPGPRGTDGVWAPAWYEDVYRSTAFAPPGEATAHVPVALAPILEPALAPILEPAQACYRRLAEFRLVVA